MRYQGWAVLTVLFTFSAATVAVTPQFWEDFSQADLLKGTLTGVSLTYDGQLFLAPAYDLAYDTGQPYIFSMVGDKAGNVYIGTGHEGKVFRFDSKGEGSLYFQSQELDIFAMALDEANVLYVGTSPDGKVFKVTGPNQATEFCNPEGKYIWSMIFGDDGSLYVGTGSGGIIYKVDKSGKKSTFYTSGDDHVVCLAREASHNLLAGTSPSGLVLEINPEGKAFGLLDTTLKEIRSLAVDRFETVYAVASSPKGISIVSRASDASGTKAATVSSTVTIEATTSLVGRPKGAKTAVSEPGGEKESAGANSSIYAISKDGSTESLYNSDEQTVFDVLVRDDGSLLLATGPKGRLLSVDMANKQVTVVTDSPEEDVTRLIAVGDVIYVAGSNQGKIYRLQPRRAEAGLFESEPLDAETVASWGKISWHVSNPTEAKTVELFTRTGNTEKPDKSWSSWSAPYSSPGQQIDSPRARYLQWRASFKRARDRGGAMSERLDRVRIPYLQQNLRPQVVTIEVLPSGIELQKPPSLTAGSMNLVASFSRSEVTSFNSPRERGREIQPLAPRQVLQPGAQAFSWKATDDNDDALEFSLYFRGEGESDWKQLEKKITDSFYTLNTASLPDGVYQVKVVASDAPSNPYDRFLIAELISDSFVIANTTPRVQISDHKVDGRRLQAQFRADVDTGHVASAEFSIDGGEWYLVFPIDGIADSAHEQYRLATPELSAGEHLLGIRASDGDGNTGTAKLVVKIK